MARISMYRKLNPSGAQPREISEVVNNLVEGKSNNTGVITLASSVVGLTTTTIVDDRIGFDSVIVLTAMSATAAPFTSSMYISSRTKGTAVITHAINTVATALFNYIVVG